jgi:hypothetical protein
MNNPFQKTPQQLEQERKQLEAINKLYDEQEKFKGKFDPREHILKKLAAVELTKFLKTNKTLSLINVFALIMVYGVSRLMPGVALIIVGLFLAANIWFVFTAEKQLKFYKQKYNL